MARWLGWTIVLFIPTACGFPRPPDIGPGGDASIDSPDDASFCLGDAMVTVCLAHTPAAPLMIDLPTMIDTDQPGNCAPDVVSASAVYCIVAGSSITIAGGQTLSAHGSRPLVLMSSTAITVMGTIDVAGHVLGVPQVTGPGSSACAPATAATTGGGGSGGSFGSIGGGGGADASGHLGGVPSGRVVPSTLRGGCSGEAGLDGGGAAGRGGGAVALLAVTRVQIDGVINASGGGGGGASMTNSRGGGGGGAGGMIVIDAPMVTGGSGAAIFANGGGGGEGNGAVKGENGSDAPLDPNLAASGGVGTTTGGNGGRGANKEAQGGNAAGAGGAGTSQAGGGGGGGGVGVIKVYQGASLPGTVSPPPS